MSNEKPISIRRDEDRLANLAPRRDAGPVSEADVWQGTPQKVADERVRKVRADQYRDFFRRRFGRVATEQEVAEYLGE